MLHALQRQGATVGHVRTPQGFEVDFHARLPDGRQHLVQVCPDLSSPDTLQRDSMSPPRERHLALAGTRTAPAARHPDA